MKLSDKPVNFSDMSVSTLKSTLRNLMFKDLSEDWSKSTKAAITHLIHPCWRPRKLPTSMHCRFSHVMYHCLAVNRAPFRRWLYKIGRYDSEFCRFGCLCEEDADHVLFQCPQIDSERRIVRDICLKNDINFDLKNLLTHSSLQMPVERLLLSFLSSPLPT